MRIAIAQINPVLGDFGKNADKILSYVLRAKEKHADLVVFSELTLFGYPPNDLLERSYLVQAQEKVLKKMLKKIPKDISVVLGAIIANPGFAKKGGKPYQNVAVVVVGNKKPFYIAKKLLPSYDVFDEARFFESGTHSGVLSIPNCGRVAVSVCEDMWAQELRYENDPFKDFKKVDLVVNISASPFTLKKNQKRLKIAKNHSRKCRAPFVYVNQVGGQDETIFDGQSFILDKNARLLAQAVDFEEDLLMVDLKKGQAEYRPRRSSDIEVLRSALVLGIRDFINKTGQKSVHLGLSGGIDSAVMACLAVDALGVHRVCGLLLPGPYSSEGSIVDSEKLASQLKIRTIKIGIQKLFEESKKIMEMFDLKTNPQAYELALQNVQARFRALILMIYSNMSGSMLLSTSNKSEMATGYTTLYGDMCGGLAPLGDLLKRDIYALASLYNKEREIIPSSIIKKAPSAELAPNQKDQDTLPSYEILDQMVEDLVVNKKSPRTSLEKWLEEKLFYSEFKRWQSPPILKVTEHSFGRGRRMPISRGLENLTV